MSRKRLQPIENKKECELSVHRFKQQVDFTNVRTVTTGLYSKSSELAIASDWNRFVSFCHANNVSPLPASVAAVRLFLEKEAANRKYSSIKRYSVSLGIIHKVHGYPDPCLNRQVRLSIKQLEQTKKGDARQANEFTEEHLSSLYAILDKEKTNLAYRDIAIYFVMFECALKRSELKKLKIEDIEQTDLNSTISIQDNRYPLSEQASTVLKRWLKLLPETGVCFRRIDRHGNIGDSILDDSSIYRVLRRASDRLGMPENLRFTAQSPRVGAARELSRQGHKLKDIQIFGRWLSPAMPAQYLELKDTSESEMSKFKTIRPWD
ncbi:tyrosine-type recombinase/integrase [Vibrio sp. HN007]|uniref:tyrosine-type recombinase/integrase n=1 Tax=Vibrio iocasae TaxID=3098914 RepID=UPI0035D50B8B